MNEWIKRTLGVSAAGLLIILASNGKALVDALYAAWLFLLKLSASAPLGLASFALALALAVAAQAFVQRLLESVQCARSRETVLSAVALVFGFGVMFLQLRTTFGALLGLLAGFTGPFAYQALGALVGLIRRSAKGAK